jgi:hypothetical protein
MDSLADKEISKIIGTPTPTGIDNFASLENVDAFLLFGQQF